MNHIGTVVDRADLLFRQDTVESIAEALELYIRAAKLLGPKSEITDPNEMLGYRASVSDRLRYVSDSGRGRDLQRILSAATHDGHQRSVRRNRSLTLGRICPWRLREVVQDGMAHRRE